MLGGQEGSIQMLLPADTAKQPQTAFAEEKQEAIVEQGTTQPSTHGILTASEHGVEVDTRLQKAVILPLPMAETVVAEVSEEPCDCPEQEGIPSLKVPEVERPGIESSYEAEAHHLKQHLEKETVVNRNQVAVVTETEKLNEAKELERVTEAIPKENDDITETKETIDRSALDEVQCFVLNMYLNALNTSENGRLTREEFIKYFTKFDTGISDADCREVLTYFMLTNKNFWGFTEMLHLFTTEHKNDVEVFVPLHRALLGLEESLSVVVKYIRKLSEADGPSRDVQQQFLNRACLGECIAPLQSSNWLLIAALKKLNPNNSYAASMDSYESALKQLLVKENGLTAKEGDKIISHHISELKAKIATEVDETVKKRNAAPQLPGDEAECKKPVQTTSFETSVSTSKAASKSSPAATTEVLRQEIPTSYKHQGSYVPQLNPSHHQFIHRLADTPVKNSSALFGAPITYCASTASPGARFGYAPIPHPHFITDNDMQTVHPWFAKNPGLSQLGTMQQIPLPASGIHPSDMMSLSGDTSSRGSSAIPSPSLELHAISQRPHVSIQTPSLVSFPHPGAMQHHLLPPRNAYSYLPTPTPPGNVLAAQPQPSVAPLTTSAAPVADAHQQMRKTSHQNKVVSPPSEKRSQPYASPFRFPRNLLAVFGIGAPAEPEEIPREDTAKETSSQETSACKERNIDGPSADSNKSAESDSTTVPCTTPGTVPTSMPKPSAMDASLKSSLANAFTKNPTVANTGFPAVFSNTFPATLPTTLQTSASDPNCSSSTSSIGSQVTEGNVIRYIVKNPSQIPPPRLGAQYILGMNVVPDWSGMNSSKLSSNILSKMGTPLGTAAGIGFPPQPLLNKHFSGFVPGMPQLLQNYIVPTPSIPSRQASFTPGLEFSARNQCPGPMTGRLSQINQINGGIGERGVSHNLSQATKFSGASLKRMPPAAQSVKHQPHFLTTGDLSTIIPKSYSLNNSNRQEARLRPSENI